MKNSLSLAEKLRLENDNLQSKYLSEAKENKRNSEELKAQLREAENALERQKSQSTELMHVLKIQTEEFQSVCAENNSLKARFQQLQESSSKESERLQRDLSFLNQVCNSRGNDVTNLTKQLESLQRHVDQETSRAEAVIQQLKHQLESRTVEWQAVKEEGETLRKRSEELLRERNKEEEKARLLSAKLQQQVLQIRSSETEVNAMRQRVQEKESNAAEASQRVDEIVNLLTIKAAEAEDMTNFEIKLLIHLIKNRKKLTLVLNNNGSGASNTTALSSTKFY